MKYKGRALSAIITVAQIFIFSSIIALSHTGSGAKAAGTISIAGTVTAPNGGDEQNVSVYATNPGGSTVEYGPVSTAADGTYELNVEAGTYDFHFDPQNSNNLSSTIDGDVTVLNDQTINVQLVPATHTFSTTITDSNGNPIPGLIVALVGNTAVQGATNSSGQVSITAPAGSYNVSLQNPGNGNNPNELPTNLDLYNAGSGLTVDLTSSDVTQNIVLDTATLTVTVKDSSGQVVPNADVSIGHVSGTAAATAGGNSYSFGISSLGGNTTTDSNGIATFVVPQGTVFNPTNIQVFFADGTSTSNSTTVTASQDIDLVFQEEPPVPSAPTNLTALSPTNQAPALTWTAAAGATSYNIYRNGTDIGSSTTTSYTDTTAPQGMNSYYVTAVNGGGESAASNTIIVIYDTTPPTISYTISPTPNSADWNNSPVTVTFNCTDNTGGSGIASCSAPQTESNDGTYTLTGTAVDNAGNTASVNVTVNLDQTPPALGAPSLSTDPITVGSSTTLTVPVSDSLSGVNGGEYFIGSDPGQGNGRAMTYSSSTGNFTATLGSNLAPGTYTVNFRAEDIAGNWANVSTISLTVNPPLPSAPTNLTAVTPTNQSPSLSWSAVTYATSYNIYRNGTKIAFSNTNSFTDTTAAQGSNSYYVTAVNAIGESSSSNTITVVYDTTLPTITYTVVPNANSDGWNNSAVTVTFSCNDSGTGVGIASCTAPVALNTNGTNQTVTGTAVDNAGNTASVTTAPINIDESVPMVGTPSWSTNPVVAGNNTTVTASATAAPGLSAIKGGEYYIGNTDPGQGNGTAMTYNSSTGNLTASLGSSLSAGTYAVNIRAENDAGVWSNVVSTNLIVNPATSAPNITSANSYSIGVRQIITPSDFTVTATGTPTPSLTESGTLPSGLSFTDNGNGTANFTGMVAAGTAGTYNITIKATNSAGTKTQSFALTITNTDSAPTTIFTNTGSDNLTATKGTSTTFTFTATGNGTNQKMFLYSGSLPSGMNLHDNKNGTGTISGTPTATGTYTFTIEAENKDGVTYQEFMIVVNA